MKNLIYLFLFTLTSTSCTSAQPEWTELTYHFRTGTVPPPYFYSYNININSTGAGNLVYFPSYSNDSSWVYDFKITDSQMIALNNAINESGILSDSIPQLEKHPVGGSIQNLRVVLKQDPNLDQVPKSVNTPDFPEQGYKQKLEKLYETIRSFVPQSLWDDVKAKKEGNIKKEKIENKD